MTPVNQTKAQALLKYLSNTLIASCQPVDNGPMDKTEIIVAMALAAIAGGAKAVRIEGVANVKAVVAATDVPVVGIVKRDLTDSPIRITPFVQDVEELAAAGASIIAFDGTDRVRPETVETILDAIHANDCVAMADCADYAMGVYLAQQGCTFIGSTMSGYIDLNTTPETPDYALVESWVKEGLNVIAEGRYNSVERAAKAIQAGALSVTVGSAITRVEHIAQWFVHAIEGAKTEESHK